MNGRFVFEPRTYRDFGPRYRFTSFRVTVESSDLYVRAQTRLESQTEQLIRRCRAQIEAAIQRRPEFLTAVEPIEEHPDDGPVPRSMVRAARKAGTGPMAAVAGAVAEFVGHGLLEYSDEVIVENGGDVFLKVNYTPVVGIHAGDSPLSGRIGIKPGPSPLPLGVCTSSGRIGHSMSDGIADCATVLSRNTALADAVATAMGNRIHGPSDLQPAVEWALGIRGVDAALIVLGETIAAKGNFELVPGE